MLTFLPQLWLALLNASNNHIPNTSIRQPIQPCTKAIWLDDKQTLCPAVVCAIQNGTHRQTKGHAEFVARSSTAYLLDQIRSLEWGIWSAYRVVSTLC